MSVTSVLDKPRGTAARSVAHTPTNSRPRAWESFPRFDVHVEKSSTSPTTMNGKMTYSTPNLRAYLALGVNGEKIAVLRGVESAGLLWSHDDLIKLLPPEKEGLGALYHHKGWTILTYWHLGWACAFVGESISSPCTILDEARRNFPNEAPKCQIRLDDHRQELIRAARKLSKERT